MMLAEPTRAGALKEPTGVVERCLASARGEEEIPPLLLPPSLPPSHLRLAESAWNQLAGELGGVLRVASLGTEQHREGRDWIWVDTWESAAAPALKELWLPGDRGCGNGITVASAKY